MNQQSKIYSNYEMHQIQANEKVDDLDQQQATSKYYLKSNQQNKPIEGSSIQKIVEKNPDIQDFDETVEIVDSVVIDHVSEDDKSISSEEVTYERWTEETKLFKTKVFQNGELVNEIFEQSNPELVGDILREKLIERHEHITHISQDVKKRLKTKSPGQSRRESLDINEILNEDLNGSSIIIVEPTVPSSARRNSHSDNTYYIQHQQVITPSQQTCSTLHSGTKVSKFKTHLPAYLKLKPIAYDLTSSSSSSSSISSPFLLNHNHSTDAPLTRLINQKKNSSNLRKRFSKLKSKPLNSNKSTLESFYLSSSSSSTDSSTSIADLKCTNTKLNIEQSLLSSSDSSLSSSKCFLITKDETIKPELNQIQQISNISTFYGGLEAHNYADKTDDVLIVRADYREKDQIKKQSVTVPAVIDIRSSSPVFNSKNAVDKRTELAKSQYEKITQLELLSSSSSSSDSSSFDKVSVDYIITGVDSTASNKNDDDDFSDNIDFKSNEPDLNKSNKSSTQQPENKEDDSKESDYILIDKLNELTQSYCDVNYELNEDTYQNNEAKQTKSKLLDLEDNTTTTTATTSDSLESMERFERPTKHEMAKQQQLKQDSELKQKQLIVIDDDNSSHIDSFPNNSEQIISKGLVKNYALMFQQQQQQNIFKSDLSNVSSVSSYKKINLSKFEQKDDNNKYKKLIDQFNNLNDCINSVLRNQTDIDNLTDCANKTRDLFDLFYLEDSNKSVLLNNKFNIEFETYSQLFQQLKNSNLNHNQIIFNLDALKSLIEFKFVSILKSASSGSSNQSEMNKNYFLGSSSNYSNNQFSDKISPMLIQDKIEEQTETKQEDSTDVSDDDEQNIFESSSNLIISNSPQSVLEKVKVFDSTDKPRATPLRRESFEMAQKDAACKRFSLSVSINNNNSTQMDANSTSDSSVVTPTVNQKQSINKRLLSEIKPTEIMNQSDEYQVIDNDFETFYLDDDKKGNYFLNMKPLNEMTRLENESANLLLVNSDKSNESDSSDSSRHILQRNYDILRKKSTKKPSKGYLTTEEQKIIDSFDDEDTKQNTSNISSIPKEPQSFISSSNLIPKQEETAIKSTPKVRVVPKTDLKNRSVSPGMLRRGPDIIETIETTTSMSFIMNKRVNLVVEEKRLEPPNRVESSKIRFDKPKLTSAFSQPQLYQSEIDDLLDSTGNLIINNANLRQQQKKQSSNSTPIPITVQSRSKSEPRLNMDPPNRAHIIVSHDFNNLDSYKRRPLCSNGKYYEIPTQSPENNRITFHKYDSNEIIALVNMPQPQYETTTVESVTNESKSYFNSKNFSRSVPNLNNKFDSWSVWPEYTVDQETDISLNASNDLLNKTTTEQKPKPNQWVKEEIWPQHDQRQRSSYPDCFQFEIQVEKRPTIDNKTNILIENIPNANEIIIQSDYSNTSNELFNKKRHLSRLNSNSAVNTTNGLSNNTSVEQEIAAATRISSGYFSGDEFRSYYNTINNGNINSIINAPLPVYYDQNSSNSNFYTSNNNSCSSPNSASNEATQFNINKFLNKKNKSKKDALEEFNTMYKSLGLEEDEIIFERTSANHPLYNKIDIDIDKNNYESKINFCQSSPNLMNRKTRSRSTNYDKLDHERYTEHYSLDQSETFSNFSIYNDQAKPIYIRKQTQVADTIKDDMAARRQKPMTPSQLEREIYINHSYLNKSPANLDQSFSSSNYNTSFNYTTKPINTNEPDINRDDASILNMRKRSNSMSSLSCANSQLEVAGNPLILPSPTSADYLRNRIRETNLFNVVMNPTKSTNDVELSQILYDDMAYRNLRKDSDASKLAQIKSAANNLNNQTPSTPIVNIATLPLNYSSKNPQQTDQYYQQYFAAPNTPFESNDYDSMFSQQTFSNKRQSNLINDSFNNIKTVKMIKQKDATNKNLKQSNVYSSSKMINPHYDANRYLF